MNKRDELIEKFISTIKTKPSNTKKLFSLGMAGLTGSGKSFVAEKISKRLNLYVGSNDRIRRFLNEQGIEGSNPAQDLVEDIGPISSCYLYENKISHIIDADLMKLNHITRENAKSNGALFYMVHTICPEDIILERIEKRAEEVANGSSDNLSRVGKEEYFKRKEIHESLPPQDIFHTIDTSKELDFQIDKLIKKLKEEKVI